MPVLQDDLPYLVLGRGPRNGHHPGPGDHGPLTRILIRQLLRRDLPDESAREAVFTDWCEVYRLVDGLVREGVERSKTRPVETPEPPLFRTAVEGATLAP